MNSTHTVMAHMIPFYPSEYAGRRVAEALIHGGVSYLEVQFPYSDPTADGPAIQAACAGALENGFRVAAGWRFVRDLRADYPAGPSIFLMSYAGLVFAYGIDRFMAAAAEHGVTAVIVPDLPIDSDEGLFEAGRRVGVDVVPVIAFGAGSRRLDLIGESGARWVYASLRRGITGSHTEIGPRNIEFLSEVGRTGARVMAGFGISTREQVAAVTTHAHAAVVGSAFVRQAATSPEDPYPAVLDLARALTGAGAHARTG